MLKDQFSETAVISLAIATWGGSVIVIKIVNSSKFVHDDRKRKDQFCQRAVISPHDCPF